MSAPSEVWVVINRNGLVVTAHRAESNADRIVSARDEGDTKERYVLAPTLTPTPNTVECPTCGRVSFGSHTLPTGDERAGHRQGGSVGPADVPTPGVLINALRRIGRQFASPITRDAVMGAALELEKRYIGRTTEPDGGDERAGRDREALGPMREPDEIDRRATAAVAAAHSKVCIAEDKVQRMIVDALAAERARVVAELQRRRAQGGPTSYDTDEASLAYTDALGEMIEWMDDTTAAARGTGGDTNGTV